MLAEAIQLNDAMYETWKAHYSPIAERIIRVLERRQWATAREIWRQSRYLQRLPIDQIKYTLELLVELEMAVKLPSMTGVAGRPTVRYTYVG